MTTQHNDIDPSDTQAVIKQLEDQIAAMERAREDQPERLAKARSDAEESRGWALIEEPLNGQVKSLASIDGTASLSFPNITARELWGARLCFDLLDCGDDFDQIDEVISRLFSAANGDTGIAMVIMSAALSTIASLVVPQLLDEIEHSGSNYNERVRLAEARAKAWNGRVSELRGPQADAADCGVRPVDGYDIGADALDPDTEANDIRGGGS
jgi:hypothetical protein